MPRIHLVFAAGILGCAGSPSAGAPSPDVGQPPALAAIREEELRADLHALAGDGFRGREAGTLDELRASAWIAERARQAGLAPAGEDGTYFQFWPMARVRPSAATTIRVGTTDLPLHAEAVLMSQAGAVLDAPLVDGGDGKSLGGADLAGKAVIVQIGKPRAPLADDVSLRPVRYVFAFLGETTAALATAKPAAIVLVSDAVADSAWPFISAWFKNGTYGLDTAVARLGPDTRIPMIWVKRATRPLLVPGQRLQASIAFDRYTYPSVNVVAKVPGNDPALRGQYVLYSAHQDHDGIKSPVAGDSIWNGADDNASVSVGILAIGRAFVRRPARRSTLFVWHGAEEKGLIGSRYHAEHPMVPRDSIVAVLNADMIGANHPDTAALLGAQPPHLNSPELAAMGIRANAMVSRFVIDSLWDRPTHPEGWYFRSDHVPYAQKGIPSLYFSSLPHPLYHTPLDEPARINYPKMTRIVKWMYATGWLAANADARVKAVSRSGTR
jgi:hypothetical protein